MRYPICTSLSILCLAVVSSAAFAFDNDYEINDINLNEENFLDINAHRFRKSLDYQWYDSNNGWRMNGASLDGDLAFLQTELKLQSELSDYLNVRLELEQEIFYANKDAPQPTVEVELYPMGGKGWAGDIGVSIVGTPAYEKREMDVGLAVIVGRRPWNFTRLEYIEIDSMYNEKNSVDNSYYNTQPWSLKLHGAYQFGQHYKFRYSLKREDDFELIDPDTSGRFTYKGNNYSLLFDYLPTPETVIGITLDGFTLDKSKALTGYDQQQATEYISTDIYWVNGMGEAYEIRVGTQYDYITNSLRDYVDQNNDLDYHMSTLQLYTSAYHPFNEHMAWDLGLYVGDVQEKQNYVYDNSRDTLNEGIQAKFRMGFIYASSDGRSNLQFNISLNLDDPIDDPGDGGGISFQTVF